jgi:hypothetical protein
MSITPSLAEGVFVLASCMTRNIFRDLFQDVGLLTCPPFYRDGQFYLALLAGLLVLAVIYLFVPVHAYDITLRQWSYFIALVIWQPFWEELLFRGIIQGQLYKSPWGKRARLKVSNANMVSSLAFAALHIAYNPDLWSVSVFVPSLVFGYFRERHNTTCSAIALHSIYNLGYMVVLILKPGYT